MPHAQDALLQSWYNKTREYAARKFAEEHFDRAQMLADKAQRDMQKLLAQSESRRIAEEHFNRAQMLADKAQREMQKLPFAQCHDALFDELVQRIMRGFDTKNRLYLDEVCGTGKHAIAVHVANGKPKDFLKVCCVPAAAETVQQMHLRLAAIVANLLVIDKNRVPEAANWAIESLKKLERGEALSAPSKKVFNGTSKLSVRGAIPIISLLFVVLVAFISIAHAVGPIREPQARKALKQSVDLSQFATPGAIVRQKVIVTQATTRAVEDMIPEYPSLNPNTTRTPGASAQRKEQRDMEKYERKVREGSTYHETNDPYLFDPQTGYSSKEGFLDKLFGR